MQGTRDYLENLFNYANAPIIVWNPESRIVRVNHAFEHLTGYKDEEVIGRKLRMFFPEASLDESLNKIQQALSGEYWESVEIPILCKNEDIRVALWNSANIYAEDGTTLLSTIAQGIDISLRKQAEETLKEKNQLVKDVINSAQEGIIIYDRDLRYKVWNPFMEQLSGVPASDVLDHHPSEVFPFLRGAGVIERLEQALAGEAPRTIDFPFSLSESDRSGWTSDTSSPLRNAEGEINGVISIVRDITDRNQAEGALRESEEKFRIMMESMIEPVYIRSSDFRVEYMNPAMIRRTGRDATGGFCFKVLHDLDEKCSWCISDKVQQDKYIELEIVSPKDNRSYHISSSPIVHGDGSISKMTVLRDTTDLKKLETQLLQAQKMEAIGTLAGGIAHDFNNILGGIMGFAQLAKMNAPEGSEVIADLKQVLKSGKRAVDLVKQILTVSRQHKKEQRPMQIRYIFDEALKLLRATLPSTIEIREDLAKDTGVVNADPTQMHQVIMNLCTNAGHAMQEGGGVLEVSLANVELDDLSASKHLDLNAGSYVRLTVSDTGYGMTSKIMDRIFDPYFTTKDTGEGTGLGLSVSQGIVKAHEGTITAYSEPGKGTTFHVYLPVIPEAEKAEKEESEQPLPTGSERILFIDDEQVLIDVGRRMLERLEYEVVTKRSSIEALELFRREPDRFDLVITDMTMPHMTGDKLAQELMKIRSDIPVILCTGHSSLVSEEKANDMGIRAFVMKPITNRVIAETVRRVLDEK